MTVREVLFNSSTGDVNIENSDGATTSYNLADVVRVSTSSDGGNAYGTLGVGNFSSADKLFALPRFDNLAIVIGDSITRAQGPANNCASWAEYAAIASKGAIKLLDNKGINGNKTSDILARISDVTSSAARWVWLSEVANDAMNGVTVSQHRTNMRAILIAILTAGQIPVVFGAPPVNTYNVWQYNAADQALCAELGVLFVQPWMACVANGGWIDTTWSIDGTHPTPKAARTAGVAAWALVSKFFTGSPDLTWTNDDPSGMLTNGCFLTNSSGVPTGWTGAANVTHTAEAGTGDVVGNWWVQTATSITGWAVSSRTGIALPTGWLPGDTVRMSCRIRTVGVEANGSGGNMAYPMGGKMGVYISLNWGGVSDKLFLRAVEADIEGVYSIDGVIPALTSGTSTIQVVITQTAAASGAIAIAQLNVHNISRAARL